MSEDTLFDDQIVRLNIGGKKFITSKTTLVSKGENFFSGLLGGVIRSTKIEGYYFIDRDGKYFKAILEFLRTGHLEIPDGISELALLREMQFYGIDLSHQTSFLSGNLITYHLICRYTPEGCSVLSNQGNHGTQGDHLQRLDGGSSKWIASSFSYLLLRCRYDM
eukprot:TRINITY_DN10373_c0_g1_i2.p1 TRINITY_DN10373_c0_g1~~TRINITY_DN10373_c0_g1_i2.p1  ORF type:complete len:182 (+),score=26.11 TRINITY_DN10373_c0_g1_i2:57-548(+)